MDEKRSFTVPIVAALLWLVPCLYVGAYLATVEPASVFALSDDGMMLSRVPRYPIGGENAQAFFYPVHWLDRKVRPDNWRWLPQMCLPPSSPPGPSIRQTLPAGDDDRLPTR